MDDQELRMVIVILKVLVFPVVGFVAGFFVKWFLQSRKSRDELLRALAVDRAHAFQALWQDTLLPPEIRRLNGKEVVPSGFLRARNDELLTWYYAHANALFLSWRATRKLFKVLDLLRSKDPLKSEVDKAFSRLRTALKRDCGIYTAWEAWRRLPAPRAEESGATAAFNTSARPSGAAQGIAQTP